MCNRIVDSRLLLISFLCAAFVVLLPEELALAAFPSIPKQQVHSSTTPGPTDLVPGALRRVEMRGGEKHRYEVRLAAEEYVELVADQKGIDVRVYLYDPNGRLLTRAESPNGAQGPEILAWIAKTSGNYTLEIEANRKDAPPGKYEVRIAQLRPKATLDEMRVTAASTLSEAVILEFDGDDSASQSVEKYKEALPLLRQLQDSRREDFTMEGLCVELQKLASTDKAPEHTAQAESLYSESISYCEAARQFAETARNSLQARWTYRAGIAYEQTGQKDKAADSYQKAASLYSDLNDKQMEAPVVANLASLHIRAGNYPKALLSLQHELELRESVGSASDKAICLNRLGFVYLQVGQKEKVLATHAAAIEAARQAGDKGQEASALESRGNFLVATREPLQAIEEFKKAVPLRQAVKDKAGETTAYIGLASACDFFKYGPENEAYRKQRQEYLALALDAARLGRLFHQQAYILQLIGNSYELPLLEFDVNEAQRKVLLDARAALIESRVLYHSNGTPAEQASVSIDLAKISEKLDEKQEAVIDLQNAIAQYQKAGASDGEADTLDRLATEYFRLQEYTKAFEAYLQLEQVRTSQNKVKETAFAIASQGKMQLALGNTTEAVRLFEQTLKKYGEESNVDGRAECERYLGVAYIKLEQDDRALTAFNKEFILIKGLDLEFLQFLDHRGVTEMWDPEMVTRQKEIMAQPALTSLSEVWDRFAFTSLTNWTDQYFIKIAGDIFRSRHFLLASTSLLLANVLQMEMELVFMNEHSKAFLNESAALKKNLPKNEADTPIVASENDPQVDWKAQGDRLQADGVRNAKRESCKKAIASFEQALELRRQAGSPKEIAETLTSMSEVWLLLSEGGKALAMSQEAREKWHIAGDEKNETEALLATGVVFNWLGERQRALKSYQQALQLANEHNNKKSASTALYRIGETYLLLGEKRTALDNLLEGQNRSKSQDYPDGDGQILALIGFTYASLGDQRSSIEYYRLATVDFERAFSTNLMFFDLKNKAHLYNQLGDAYNAIGDSKKALETFRKGLLVQRNFGSLAEQAYSLDKMGEIFLTLGGSENNTQAIESFEVSLECSRKNGNPIQEAEALQNLGVANERTGEWVRARSNYNQALAIRYRLKDPEGQGETLDRLMQLSKSMNQPSLAAFYGKQAVNVYQQMRVNMQGIGDGLEKSYLNSHSKTYRNLADILIVQGRIPEAQEVLALLKTEEYLDFVRRDGSEAMIGSAGYVAREMDSRQRFQDVQDRILITGQRFAELSAKEQLSSSESTEFSSLEKDLVAANLAYDSYLSALPQHFAVRAAGEARVETLREAKGLQDTLRELGNGTVALFTVISDDRYHVILITSETQKPFTYEIKGADLNRKLAQFRQVLNDPKLDPIPLARELYAILVGPIEGALQEAQAKTLMWSLDGALRYIPIAALHDGRQYLVEKYDITMFTPASHSRLERPPSAQWRGLGLGVSKGSHPLPYVREELHSVIRDDSAPNSEGGAISGKILLDNLFTKEAMKDALQHGRGYSLVHVASHFRFMAGNEYDSYLLLGGPEQDSDLRRHLSLAEIKSGTNIFHGVELLTLSACNTAVGSSEGSEVENFAVLAQLKGASAVIATLWPVADISTMHLMQNFYRSHNDRPEETKIGSLRQAQLGLLYGCVEGDCIQTASSTQISKEAHIGEVNDDSALTHKFHTDPRAPFAHPYFWAPFVLIGNWR